MNSNSTHTAASTLAGRKLIMLLCLAGAPFLIMLDTNIVAVSLPAIARDLHGTFTDVEWVVSAYILPFTALLMPAGAMADRFGRRRMLIAGMTIFTAASLACGFASTIAMLNGARALQAVGAALQLSASIAAMAQGFEAHERARVYAIWGTVMGVAPSLGPIVGGFATSYFGWRWAFYINGPLGALLIGLALTSVKESRDPKTSRLDYRGIVLFGTGLFSVVWALIGATAAGWSSATTLVKLAAGMVLLGLFLLAERRHPRPMIDLEVFRDPTVVGATLAMFGYAASAQVMMTLLPLYLQDAYGHSPWTAGLAMIPFALPFFIGPSIGGRLAARLPSAGILRLGLGFVALGDLTAAAAVLLDLDYWAAAIGMVVTGLGAGILNSETAKALVSSMPVERAGMASGLASTTRFVGIISGVAGLGGLLAAVAEARLRRLGTALVSDVGVDWHGLSSRIVAGDARAALTTLPAALHELLTMAVHESIAAGFGAVLGLAALIAAVSSVACWKLMRKD